MLTHTNNIFSALAEPRRQQIVEMIASQGKLSSSEISDQFQITAAAISQHLKVLREAEVLTMEKKAQQRLYDLNPKVLTELEKWTAQMKKLWSARLDGLEAFLAKTK